MAHNDNIQHLFTAIDRMDTPAFLSHLTDDVTFTFGNWPPVKGLGAVEAAVDQFFSSIAGLSHKLGNSIYTASHIVIQGQVTYTRKSGSTLTVPFCNVFGMVGEKIRTYEIFADISALYTE
ncbi:MAG: nuclear transport factor 2 family protein [Calditrichaeota bacterium]|nr:nuclear transport factor 2 family protein [Calditrichota bacterium]